MEKSTASGSSHKEGKRFQVETLDTRGLIPPEPILVILAKVNQLPKDTVLEVKLDNEPMQLYDLLQQRGFLLRTTPNPAGGVTGLVQPRENGMDH